MHFRDLPNAGDESGHTDHVPHHPGPVAVLPGWQEAPDSRHAAPLQSHGWMRQR